MPTLAFRTALLFSAFASIAPLLAQNGAGGGGPLKHPSAFEHVVVVFQENRTPDNLFQGLCAPPFGSAAACSTHGSDTQYDIQTDHWANVKSPTGVSTPEPVPLATAYDLSHSHSGFNAMCNADPLTGQCRMDGAINVPCSGVCPTAPQYKYADFSGGKLNPYLELATQYGWATAMFQTNQGPSFPAHQFIFGGTSAPTAADDAAGIFAAENMHGTGISGTAAVAGCIAAASTTVQTINADGVEDPTKRIYPCFEHQTLPDVLPPSISWRYYTPSAGSIWTAPDAIQHICESTGPGGRCEGSIWNQHVDLKPADVLSDIAACKLTNLSWVIPSGINSDHPNSGGDDGPSWVASIVNAIGQSSGCDHGTGYWKNTAIIITWDDWGGWYDHVAPTRLAYPQGGYQLGFRVPFIFVSAYTPAHYINDTPHDFGSILRFLEHNFGIPEGALHFADGRASNDLQLFFNLERRPRPFHTIAAPLNAKFFVEDARPATAPDTE